MSLCKCPGVPRGQPTGMAAVSALWLEVGSYCFSPNSDVGLVENVAENIWGGEWSFKNSGSHKILVEFHGSRSLVF